MTNKLLVIILLLVSLFALSPFIGAQEETSTHIVQYGENLFRIALRYGVTVDELAAENNITNTALVHVGQSLTIPGLAAVNSSDEINNPLIATAPVLHTVQPSETLSQIAALYDVTMTQIMRANNIANENAVYAGQTLQIWTPEISITAAEAELANEAEAVSVDEAEAQPSNADTSETVSAAEETDASAESALPTSSDVPKSKREQSTTHIVRPGEHLSAIARRYEVSWAEIAEANNITNPNNITAGTELLIPTGSLMQAEAIRLASIRSLAENIEAPGAHWGVGRELVVDLSTQMAYAYEDGILQHSALVSTGLPATPTVQGEFAIWHKTPSQTMSGPGYWLPNVTWVMYFYAGYGFHTAYWHDEFGQPMSHGCVNMRPEDAEWFYNFASIGTNVYVQV